MSNIPIGLQSFASSTDLALIRANPRRFPWGRLLTIHHIAATSTNGNVYDIVEYVDRATGEETRFSVYVNSAPLSQGSKTLEGALLLAIAHGKLNLAKDGVAHARSMARACATLLNVPSDYE